MARRVLRGAAPSLLGSIVLLYSAGCSTPPATRSASDRPVSGTSPQCVEAAAAPSDREAIAALQQAVESGPLFAAASSQGPVATCRSTIAGSEQSIDYGFANGNSLRVERDAEIEYSSEEASFTTDPAIDVFELLKRIERAAFSPDGCGIDWKKAETQPSDAVPGIPAATDTIYRGTDCNCQTWMRRDAAGRVLALGRRSTC